MTQGTAGGGRPPTQAYVEKGKWVTDHLAPINATLFIGTGVLLPAMDFLRPYFPYISHVAVVLVLLFVCVLALKLSGRRTGREMPTGFVVCAGVCAAAFGIGAVASERHAAQGGAVAAAMPWVAQQQRLLLDIRDGRSENPRVALANMGIPWDFLQFAKAAKRGDAQVVSLFLAGGMPVTENTGEYFESIPYFVVASGTRPTAVLEALAQGGVNLGDPALVPSWGRAKEEVAPNLYAIAKEKHRNDVAEKLTQLGVDSSSYAPWKAAKDEYDKKPKAVFFGI